MSTFTPTLVGAPNFLCSNKISGEDAVFLYVHLLAAHAKHTPNRQPDGVCLLSMDASERAFHAYVQYGADAHCHVVKVKGSSDYKVSIEFVESWVEERFDASELYGLFPDQFDGPRPLAAHDFQATL